MNAKSVDEFLSLIDAKETEAFPEEAKEEKNMIRNILVY